MWEAHDRRKEADREQDQDTEAGRRFRGRACGKNVLNTKYISSIERAKANPTLDTFIKIADAEAYAGTISVRAEELAQLIAGPISGG